MNNSVRDNSIKRVCHHCGMPVAGMPYTREGDHYCCEGCFLTARKQRALPPGGDDMQFALAEALVCALDAREHETGLHSKRVACHTLVLAKHFTTDPQQLRQVYWGALLHDIGKIGIPDLILLKEGSLTEAEWQIMRMHPQIGHRILSSAPFMAEAAQIVLSHEERFDGTGYPRGLAGEAIPLWARLFAVIDTLDAITSDRPYRKALAFDAACAEILAQPGSQFDPLALEAFVVEKNTLREMVDLKCDVAAASGAHSAGAVLRQHSLEVMVMEKTTQSTEPEKVKCEVCLKEIPRSEAKSAEAADYVAYFCGLECYQQWTANNRTAEASGHGKGST